MSANGVNDPRQEVAALLRAAAAHVELEAAFGIDATRLPPPPKPQPAADAHARRAARAAQAQSAPRPKPKTTRPKAKPPRHVPAPSFAQNMFGPEEYNIQIPEGLSKQEQLDHVAEHIKDCQVCRLCEGRTQIVFGVGHPDADLMFIGEAPGRDEDEQGEPFVGRAGKLLTRIIEAIEMSRDEVYIANICKCRPPNNRAPTPEEMEACLPFLHHQVKIIQPRIICLLGATAVKGLLEEKTGITKLRGQFLEWGGILVMPTYHPAYLLRYPKKKRDVWHDVQLIRDTLRDNS